MIIKNFLILLFLTGNFSFGKDTDSVSIFLVKQRWHTGIVFESALLDSAINPISALITGFKYVDIGWGDEEFYRYPDFDVELALQALFNSKGAALRVEGFNFDIEKYISFSDKVFMIKMPRHSFKELCSFINKTFKLSSSREEILVEKRYGGNISFYKANGEYSLLNTCNTWVATGLKGAGQNISSKVVLVEQLFDEIEDLPQVRRLK